VPDALCLMQPKSTTVTELLQPFVNLVARCHDRITVERVSGEIFEKVLAQWGDDSLAFPLDGVALGRALFEAGGDTYAGPESCRFS